MTRYTRLAALGVAASLALPVAVSPIAVATTPAHVLLVRSSPADGARLSTPPAQVTATFDGPLLDIGTGFVVRTGGRQVSTDTVTVDGSTITVPLKGPFPAGEYTAAYRIVSQDGHALTGSFAFTVMNGSVGNSALPTPTPTSAASVPVATAEPAVVSADESSLMPQVVIVFVAAVLALALVASRIWSRRRP